MSKIKIRVLVVDDSSVFRLFITYILNSDTEIEVVGMAHDGIEALEMVPVLKPDIITIDVNMPRLGGFETTERILHIHPVPIIIISGTYSPTETAMTFNALKAGAVTILPKPEGIGHPNHETSVKQFIKMVKTMSEVKVIRRTKRAMFIENSDKLLNISSLHNTKVEIIAIGASAGGPPVLQEILLGLKANFPIPIIIVQHIDSGFTEGFCTWLRSTTSKNVVVAKTNDVLQPNTIYLPAGDHHLAVRNNGTLELNQNTPEHSCRPSVSHLFRSVKAIYGNHAVGILLTGMGNDGSVELKELRDSGAVTIVQNAATVLINGMPGEAKKIGGAMFEFSPTQIIEYLNQINQ